ncbi:MAG: zinc-dependent peptidase [Phycisphaerales bacterium]|nr:zinc-dependent peptidase [Phycisphaerales bacterium]
MRFFRNRRRRTLLADPIPESWREVLLRHCRHYRDLDPDRRSVLEDKARILVAETEWVGCGGLELDEHKIILIAANAVLLVLENDVTLFEHVPSVLVYPSGVVISDANRGGGLVAERMPILGQASYRGPIILSFSDALMGSRSGQTRNVVLHEFAHAMDMLDGRTDGTPPMPADRRARWATLFQDEYEKLRIALDAGQSTMIDPYAATNPAEFFAVLTEHYFEQSERLKAAHPPLWGALNEYYGYSFA